jgi:hypothetical protein
MAMTLDSDLASRLARIALGHVTREYPHKLDHVLDDDGDALTPRVLHSIFYGSFDWHSCVHGWWTLLTLRRMFPDVAEAPAIAALANESFTPAKVAAELAYLGVPHRGGSSGPMAGRGCSSSTSKLLATTKPGQKLWNRSAEPSPSGFATIWQSSPTRSAPALISTRLSL